MGAAEVETFLTCWPKSAGVPLQQIDPWRLSGDFARGISTVPQGRVRTSAASDGRRLTLQSGH